MSRRFWMISRSQRGFTLVEMLVAVAITSIIVPTIGMSTFQVLSGNARSVAHMIAVKQVESAVHRISRDVQMAQIVQTGGGSGFPLTLTWVKWDNTEDQVTYTIQNGELERAYSINGGEPTSTVLAHHINTESGATSCQFVNGVFTFQITASLEGFKPASETRVGKIIPRSQ